MGRLLAPCSWTCRQPSSSACKLLDVWMRIARLALCTAWRCRSRGIGMLSPCLAPVVCCLRD